MRIGICDEDIWFKKAAGMLEAYGKEQEQKLSVTLFDDVQFPELYTGAALHVLFIGLDLNAAGRIELACKVNEYWSECQIVYMAESMEYAMDVYRSQHLYFVLKNQFQERLPEIMDMACYRLGRIRKNIILNVQGKEQLVFDPQELMYFERERRITRIVSTRGEFITSEKISSLIERLPMIDFVRCHNSYIVYLPAVEKYVKNIFRMKDGRKILISRGYSSSTRKAFERWKKINR